MSTVPAPVLNAKHKKQWLVQSQSAFSIQIMESPTTGYVSGVLHDPSSFTAAGSSTETIGTGLGAPTRKTMDFQASGTFDGSSRRIVVDMAVPGDTKADEYLLGLAREVTTGTTVQVNNRTALFHWSLALDSTCVGLEAPLIQKRDDDGKWQTSTDIQLVGKTCAEGTATPCGLVMEVTAFSTDPAVYQVIVRTKTQSGGQGAQEYKLEIEAFDSGIGAEGAQFDPLPSGGN